MNHPVHILLISIVSAPVAAALAQPVITRQPTNQSASLGATSTFQVTARGMLPLRYQWRFNQADIVGATNRLLSQTNVQLKDAGDYVVVVSDPSGSTNSRLARLEVDPTFTKIATGPLVSEGGFSFGCSWGDYDQDGRIDLFVCNWEEDNGSQRDFLYHNNGDGTFSSVRNVAPVQEGRWAAAAAWGDYDNDGYLDLFVARPGHAGANAPNTLYHNNGDGTFTKIRTGLLVTEPMCSHTGIWGDFDNDGFLDLFVVNFDAYPFGAPTRPAKPNYLYRNSGDGNFVPVSFGTKPLTNGDSWPAAAADFNNDGWLDLFVPQGGSLPALKSENSLLYTNGQGMSFTLLTNSPVFINRANPVACAWGDYDNDGFPDLFVSNFFGQNNFLYHNNGDGTFVSVTNGPVVLDQNTSVGCAWGDYDNDGWLDLFVADLGTVDRLTGGQTVAENNCLYHNNGDGTFTKITSGSLVNDLGYSTGCAWGDYDNDGFLDLFVSNGWATKSENNFLYRNNGNTNHWIMFNLVGTVSNRAAIGAKVRVKATIAGREIWQLREISGGSGYGSQNDLRAHFGLGNAQKAELVRIEWPSGIVQEQVNVPANQILTVVEPPRLIASKAGNGLDITIKGGRGFEYALEASPDLATWSRLATVTVTNLNGLAGMIRTNDTDADLQFYRASGR